MKKILLSLTFFSLLLSVRANGESDSTSIDVDNHVLDSLVDYSKNFIGTPYLWAGAAPGGFDCSGYVHYVFKKFGYTIHRSSSGLANAGSEVPLDSARKGDLILFRGTDPNDRSVGHVGIVISEMGEPLQFIHSSSSKKHFGVVITEYEKSGYPARFVGIRRVIDQENN